MGNRVEGIVAPKDAGLIPSTDLPIPACALDSHGGWRHYVCSGYIEERYNRMEADPDAERGAKP